MVRNELFAHINSFSHAEIDRFGAPSLITRLTNDINQRLMIVKVSGDSRAEIRPTRIEAFFRSSLAWANRSCSVCCQYLASRASQGFGTVVRNELFAHINSFSHAEIDPPARFSRVMREIRSR